MTKQGTDEWRAARSGRITASRIADLMAQTKSGPAASRKNYLAELLVERLTCEPTENGFVSREMQWGTDHEPEARSLYEFERDVTVEEVGFVVHSVYSFTGASPDGLVSWDGAVEIKCPNTATHIETIRTQKVPERYYAQMQWVMECCGRLWCDFVSYDPRVKIPKLQLHIQRVERDAAYIERVIEEVKKADAEIERMVAELTA